MADVTLMAALERNRLEATVRLSVPLNALYLNVPKAASTTIKRALWIAAGGTDDFTLGRQFAQPTGFRFETFDLLSLQTEPFVFSIVRNPFLRIFSAYHDKIHFRNQEGDRRQGIRLRSAELITPDPDNANFSAFLRYVGGQADELRDRHWRSLTYQTNAKFVQPDLIGDLASLDDTMAEVAKCLHLTSPLILDNKNTRASAKFMRAAYTKECERMVREIYAEDFERFGYSTYLDDALIS